QGRASRHDRPHRGDQIQVLDVLPDFLDQFGGGGVVVLLQVGDHVGEIAVHLLPPGRATPLVLLPPGEAASGAVVAEGVSQRPVLAKTRQALSSLFVCRGRVVSLPPYHTLGTGGTY